MVFSSSDKVIVGTINEIVPVDMSCMDEKEIRIVLDFIHHIAWKELLSRPIHSMKDWSARANTLFLEYDFVLIGHLAVLSKNEVVELNGCGYKTKKEIYDTCKSYGLTLPNWVPGTYYEEKPNYIF